MRRKAWFAMPVQQMLTALIGSIAFGLALIGLLDRSLGGDYGTLQQLSVSLAAAISAWGIFGVQRQLPANGRTGRLVSVWYVFLLTVFVSLYAPALNGRLVEVLLLYPVVISMIVPLRDYLVAAGAYILYCALFILFVPAYASMNAVASATSALVQLLLVVGSALLGGVILIAMHQQQKKNEERSFHRQRQQVLNTLQCFIPVGERKTQTSRKEINDMSGLMKSLWKAYGGDLSKEWEIELLSLLHFVSRVKLPDYMFEKEGKLSEFELEVVQKHCYMAKELCAGVPGFQELEQVFLYHHEKVDGTGYPFRLRGDQIPALSQMLGIVEVFIAITTPRSYRQVMSKQAAYEEIRKMAGSFYRPDIVEAFGKVIRG